MNAYSPLWDTHIEATAPELAKKKITLQVKISDLKKKKHGALNVCPRCSVEHPILRKKWCWWNSNLTDAPSLIQQSQPWAFSGYYIMTWSVPAPALPQPPSSELSKGQSPILRGWFRWSYYKGTRRERRKKMKKSTPVHGRVAHLCCICRGSLLNQVFLFYDSDIEFLMKNFFKKISQGEGEN